MFEFYGEQTDEVARRCKAAGLKFTDEDSGFPTIHFPRGRGSYPVALDSEEHAAWILGEPFEYYRLLEGYGASWSSEQQVIECSLVRGEILSPLDKDYEEGGVRETLNALGMNLDRTTPLNAGHRIILSTQGDISVSIGPRTDIQAILEGVIPPAHLTQYLTLQIMGPKARTHDEAVELLDRVGNAVLFQVDLSRHLFLRLERDWEPLKFPRVFPKHTEVAPLPPVRFEYDSGAMSLYWHGKSASSLPLLQFLAFYQVLEFYFPTYSQMEAQRVLRNSLKDPSFDVSRDADIARLLQVIKTNSRAGTFGSEVSQLEATIKHCLSAEGLRSFLIKEDESRYRFYTSEDSKKIVRKKIPVREESADHRSSVVERIYAIRNRIVHTKSGFEDQEPLFPFDPETKLLRHDIDLVRFLAQKVLIASSRPLQL